MIRTGGILLNTDVVSEARRPRPDARVGDWFRRQDADKLFLAAPSVCELAEEIERMSQGRRRRAQEAWLDGLVENDFRGRVLTVDTVAARLYGKLASAAWAQGHPPHMADAQVAAVAARDGLHVATRDLDRFAVFGVPLIDPWSDV